jgi:hypothetical protein
MVVALVPHVVDNEQVVRIDDPAIGWGGVDSVSARGIAVKKYVVTLSAEERELLQSLIRSGKHPARKLMRARILLKADASEAGDAWSDSQIADGLDTSVVTVARIRQQLVQEGVEGVLTPKRSPNSARERIFDDASEAKLIALACSAPPPLPFHALRRARNLGQRRPKAMQGGRCKCWKARWLN